MPVVAACLVISSVMVRMTVGMAATNRTVLRPLAAPVKFPVGTIRAFLEAGYAMTMWTARTNRMSRLSVAAATQLRQLSVHLVRCSAALGNAYTGSGAVTGTQTARMAVTRKTAVRSLLGLFCFLFCFVPFYVVVLVLFLFFACFICVFLFCHFVFCCVLFVCLFFNDWNILCVPVVKT